MSSTPQLARAMVDRTADSSLRGCSVATRAPSLPAARSGIQSSTSQLVRLAAPAHHPAAPSHHPATPASPHAPLSPLCRLSVLPRRVAVVGTTDIPEWVVAEALPTDHAGEMVWPLRADDLLELHRRSPLSVVDRVHAPALMLLGAADQRVPHSQGRSWVAALQHVRRHQPDAAEVVALEFPGEGHAIGSVEGNAHAVQSAVAWLVEKLRTRQANERGRSGP